MYSLKILRAAFPVVIFTLLEKEALRMRRTMSMTPNTVIPAISICKAKIMQWSAASLCLLMLFLVHQASAMTKPIAGLRDYDGTYSGAPGTGSITYTGGTLYRDSQDWGKLSGCNGEGCGSHPGVDIPVPSGTPIVAALMGTVVRSECNPTWGGLVSIRTTSPYTGETIYHSYAHLRRRNVSVNQSVAEGTVIGESGGGTSDACHGNSTGPHLHFQIDKNHSLNKPWFPANVNQADTAFQVTRYTYNPVVFVTGKYQWTFDQGGFAEFWVPQNVATWGVSGGILWIDGNQDPGIVRSGNVSCGLSKPCSGQIAAEASLYKYVMIGLQNFCVANPVKLYFTTSGDDTWTEGKSVAFNYSSPATYRISMAGNTSWTGIIKRLRIDPAVNCNPRATDPDYFYAISLGR